MPPASVTVSRNDLRELLQEAVATAPPGLNHDDLKKIVSAGVKEAFTKIGIEACEPISMQKDFAFLRSLRNTGQRMKNVALVTLVGLVVTTVCSAFWLGIKYAIAKDTNIIQAPSPEH